MTQYKLEPIVLNSRQWKKASVFVNLCFDSVGLFLRQRMLKDYKLRV